MIIKYNWTLSSIENDSRQWEFLTDINMVLMEEKDKGGIYNAVLSM